MSIDAGPFFLAYVADSTVAFDPVAHARMDEYLFSFKRIISETDKPILEVEILNPHIGLLNPSRNLWVWFSWLNPSSGHVEPLFFGRIVGNPNDAFAEVITVRFTSWPVDYFKQRQNMAELLKVPPYWDEVFVPVERSDDPDAILEARSELWCVDPITLVVTAEDILDGSDGNIVVTANDHFYDGLVMRDGDAPLTAVLMDATVSWTQTARGYVDMGGTTYITYSGDGILGDWPKPETPLGGGWSVFTALAVDLAHTASMVSGTVSGSYTNTEKTHQDGDVLSINFSVTSPFADANSVNVPHTILTYSEQIGFIDPFAVDEDGDPSPINHPAGYQETSVYAMPWTIGTAMVLRYDMARQRTERVRILLTADLQAIINDPLVTQNSETITMVGRDVGVPIVNLLNWTTISDSDVEIGQVIFPDDPKLPGGRSAQICIVAGHTGLAEPEFSDVPGDVTVDNTAQWASMGTQNPTEGAQDWTGLTNYSPGAIILPRYPLWANLTDVLAPGLLTFPPTPTPIGLGQIVRSGDFEVCVLDGLIPGSATFSSLGPQLPDGKTYYITPNGGQSGPLYVTPRFGSHTALHDTVDDNGITWISIGSGDIPAGGTPGNVWARSYFATDRGRSSLEYLMAIERAHIRKRSRAVELDFETSFEFGVPINCRKTCVLQDDRIPGGQALGKVMAAVLSGDGDLGEVKCTTTIGCAVGRGNAVATVPGVPVYAAPGYMQSGYQQEVGGVVVLPGLSDVGYTPLVAAPDDDGLVPPLDKAQVVITEGIRGSIAAQAQGIGSAFSSMALAARMLQYPAGFGFQNTIASSIDLQKQVMLLQSNSVARQLQEHPMYYEAQLKPVVNGPFWDSYVVVTQPMTIPMGIDLEATSSGGGPADPSGGGGGGSSSAVDGGVGAGSYALAGRPAFLFRGSGSGGGALGAHVVAYALAGRPALLFRGGGGGGGGGGGLSWTPPNPDITNFTAVDATRWTGVSGKEYANHNAGRSWSLTNPNTQQLRMEVRSGDIAGNDVGSDSNERSECQRVDEFSEAGNVASVKYEFMLESGSPITSWFFICGQIYSSRGGSPPFWIGIENQRMVVRIGWLSSQANTIPIDSTGDAGGVGVSYGYPYRDTVDLPRGVWHTMEIIVDYDAKTFKLVRNGVLVCDYSGPIGFGANFHWDFGIYRSGPTTNDTQAVNYRNMLIVSP